MGADGGSIPDRRDLVKTKGKLEKTDKALLRERFFYCALSKVSFELAILLTAETPYQACRSRPLRKALQQRGYHRVSD